MTNISLTVLHESHPAQDAQPGNWVIHGGCIFVRTEEPQVFVDVRNGEYKTLAADSKVRLLTRVSITAE